LRDRNKVIRAPETLGDAAPQVDADAVDRAVGLEMAIGGAS